MFKLVLHVACAIKSQSRMRTLHLNGKCFPVRSLTCFTFQMLLLLWNVILYSLCIVKTRWCFLKVFLILCFNFPWVGFTSKILCISLFQGCWQFYFEKFVNSGPWLLSRTINLALGTISRTDLAAELALSFLLFLNGGFYSKDEKLYCILFFAKY